MDVQVALWEAMAAQGCVKVVDVCETHNIPALKLHIRMGYHEQGRVTHVYGLFGRWRFYRESRYGGSRLAPQRKPGRPVVSAAAQASFGRKSAGGHLAASASRLAPTVDCVTQDFAHSRKRIALLP